MKSCKFQLFLGLALLMLLSSSVVVGVDSARYLLSKSELKDVYYQNEELEIVVVILNNDSTKLELRSLHVLIESAKIIGKNATVHINMTIPVNETLDKGESYTIYYKLSLRALVPDTYNLTVTLEIRYFAEPIDQVTVIEDWKFRVKPYIEIPPAAMVILLLMIGIIIIFIGYGIAGRIGRKKK